LNFRWFRRTEPRDARDHDALTASFVEIRGLARSLEANSTRIEQLELRMNQVIEHVNEQHAATAAAAKSARTSQSNAERAAERRAVQLEEQLPLALEGAPASFNGSGPLVEGVL